MAQAFFNRLRARPEPETARRWVPQGTESCPTLSSAATFDRHLTLL
jgi:hypothetical protein